MYRFLSELHHICSTKQATHKRVVGDSLARIMVMIIEDSSGNNERTSRQNLGAFESDSTCKAVL